VVGRGEGTMKTKMGRNQKWMIAPAHRNAIRALFVEVLGAKPTSPRPDLELYALSDGTNVGVFFGEGSLTSEQARLGTWLEFIVDDLEGAIAATKRLGVEVVEYADKAHTYFQAPGGPVYRYAKE
jgi:hypothetical protein